MASFRTGTGMFMLLFERESDNYLKLTVDPGHEYDKINILYCHSVYGRARWGGSGALYLQPAIAGLNSEWRPVFVSPAGLSGVEDWVSRNKSL